MDATEVQTLARIVKAKARRVEREVHELRRLAAQLHDAAAAPTDTSTQEDTNDQETARTHTHA